MKNGKRASEREEEGERHIFIKHTLPEGNTVDKVIFDLHGLSAEEAAARVWAVFLELGWVSE
jgi:cell division ATPase FtsA